MPDTSAATIAIGGTITTHALLLELARAVQAEGGADYGEFFETLDEAVEAIQAAAKAGTPLSVFDSTAAGGQFPNIEGFCKRNGLAFLRADDGHYTWAPSHVSLRDGELHETAGNIESGAALDVAELQAMRTRDGDAAVLAHITRMAGVYTAPGALVLEGEAATPMPDEEMVEL